MHFPLLLIRINRLSAFFRPPELTIISLFAGKFHQSLLIIITHRTSQPELSVSKSLHSRH